MADWLVATPALALRQFRLKSQALGHAARPAAFVRSAAIGLGGGVTRPHAIRHLGAQRRSGRGSIALLFALFAGHGHHVLQAIHLSAVGSSRQ